MLDLLSLVYNFFFDWFFWIVQGLVRLLAAILAIPFVFFMPKGKAYQNYGYTKVVGIRLKFIGKAMVMAFKNPV